MTGLDRNQIKLYLSIDIDNTNYDSFIDNEIAGSLAELYKYTGFNSNDSSFYFYYEPTDNYFSLNTTMLDPIIESITGFDSNGNSYDLTNSYEEIDVNKYKIENLTKYVRIKVVYKSNVLLSNVISLLRELVIYRLQKLPAFGNFISRSSAGIDGVGSESFIGEELFLSRFHSRFSQLFLVRI